jgi:4-alpha-glucanotransferase
MTSLAEVAAHCGVDAAYVDAFDRQQAVSDETLRHLIDAVGEPVDRALPPIVVRPGKAEPIRLSSSGKLAWTLQSADGNAVASDVTANGALTLPVGLTGSYRLMLEDGRDCAVLAAPAHTYQPPFFARGKRGWILAVQLYGIRTSRNWGHGDFTDLRMLLRIAAAAGAAGIGVNPLHALFDDGGAVSPYTPNSRLFLNPLYIDIEAVPDFPGIAVSSLDDAVAKLRDTELVDHAAVSAAKRRALRLAFEAFRAGATQERRDDLDAFCRERGQALERFAAFETLRHRFSTSWWDWPE